MISMNDKNAESPSVKRLKEWFVKPKLEDIKHYNQSLLLTPWDLRLLFIHYDQKGLLFNKPSLQDCSSLHKLVDSLKDSLELTLAYFYPLAGQLVAQFDQDRQKCAVFIDCNKGPGARFIHATLNMTVSDIVSPTYVPQVVNSLFDHQEGLINFHGQSTPLLSIQVTELIDGIFIGCSMNHAVVDGTSIWRFWSVWSEIHRAKGGSVSISNPPLMARRDWFGQESRDSVITPSFSLTRHLDKYMIPCKLSSEVQERIFCFSSQTMKNLKARANQDISCNKGIIAISSFQALAALIWRAVVRATGVPPQEMTHCGIPVNVRKRLDPALAEEYFGNALDAIVTTTTAGELLSHNLGHVALLFHENILNYNHEAATGFLNRWVETPVMADYSEMMSLRCDADLRTVKIGNSPKFEVYSNEFAGLGKPVGVRSGLGNKFVGKLNMYPGCEGGGSVDLQICLLPKSMAALESDQEFRAVLDI